MSPSSAVLASVIVITSTTIIRRARQGTWKSHVIETIIFGFLLLIALLIVALILPTVALVLAYLGMIGALVVNGPEVFTFLGNFGRGKGVV